MYRVFEDPDSNDPTFFYLRFYSKTPKKKKMKYVKLYIVYKALHLQNWHSGTYVGPADEYFETLFVSRFSFAEPN